MGDALGEWSQIDVGGRTADMFEPPRHGPHAPALIYLHAHGQESLANDPVFTRELSRQDLPCVCPRGGRFWWLDKRVAEFDATVTPMAYVRDTVVDWCGERWQIKPPSIGLLGIGMGGQGALQLAYRHARMFPVVAAISPAIDFHAIHGQGGELADLFETAEAARQQTATLQVHPLNWPPHQLFVCDPADVVWHEGCERLASKLSSIGIPFECDLTTSAGGHNWEYFHTMAPRCVEFVAEGLRKVRQRVPS